MTEPTFTTRDLLLEIRADVRALADKVDTIDRQGSIGTKAELSDHEERVRALEKFKNRTFGALALITAVLIPVATPVITTLLRAKGH